MYSLLSKLLCAVLLVIILVTSATLGACQPPENYAAAANGATISGPQNASGSHDQPNCVIDGEVVDYGPHHGYAWADLEVPTLITFARPAVIDTVEVILLDISLRSFCYIVSVSADGEHWQQVADMSTTPVSGWRMHQFAPLEAGHLRLDFTATSLSSDSYHLVEVGAFHLGEQRQTGPLGQAWQHVRTARHLAEVALLGVGPAHLVLQDPDLLGQLKSAPDHQPIYRDLADGTHALLYRDQGAIVVALDDDGNMTPDATGPDMVNDCLAVDLDADGLLDRSIDYSDTDGDGIADTMVQTYVHWSCWGRDPVMLLARDLDVGPLSLYHLDHYSYNQRTCQWQCDFGGDSYFVIFRRSRDHRRWIGTWENPFCFYDCDGDGLAEETVRISGSDTTIRSARFSINADNDTTAGQLYDYDVGITCLGQVPLPSEASATFTTRTGEATGQFLSWDKARQTVREMDWSRALLIWDENDHNVAARAPEHERWEGIINARYRGFPQEGGPHCGSLNKRYELDADFSGRMQLYYWPGDGRLHLYGAEVGTLAVDYDCDGRVDMVIEYGDTDSDGFFDRRAIDYRASGLPTREVAGPRTYCLPGSDAPESTVIPYSYSEVVTFWPQALAERVTDSAALMQALSEFANRVQVQLPPGPLDFYENATPRQFAYIERLRSSTEARRYYLDIAIELAFAQLIAQAEQSPDDKAALQLKAAQRLYDRGQLQRALTALATPRVTQ